MKITLIIITVSVVLVGAGLALWRYAPREGSLNPFEGLSLWGGNRTPTLFDLSDDAGDVAQGGTYSLSQGYENRAYGLRFVYPDGITVSEFEENGGFVVLLEGGDARSFQIFILPWDEGDDAITPERIRRDIPDMAINNPQVAVLSGDGRALIFESDATGIGKTREVWLANGGFLYQITAPLSFDSELARIMATWEFE